VTVLKRVKSFSEGDHQLRRTQNKTKPTPRAQTQAQQNRGSTWITPPTVYPVNPLPLLLYPNMKE